MVSMFSFDKGGTVPVSHEHQIFTEQAGEESGWNNQHHKYHREDLCNFRKRTSPGTGNCNKKMIILQVHSKIYSSMYFLITIKQGMP